MVYRADFEAWLKYFDAPNPQLIETWAQEQQGVRAPKDITEVVAGKKIGKDGRLWEVTISYYSWQPADRTTFPPTPRHKKYGPNTPCYVDAPTRTSIEQWIDQAPGGVINLPDDWPGIKVAPWHDGKVRIMPIDAMVLV